MVQERRNWEVSTDLPDSKLWRKYQAEIAGYEFGEPKFNAEESMYRECNFAVAPLKARMSLKLVITPLVGYQQVGGCLPWGLPHDDGNRYLYYQWCGACHRFADCAFPVRTFHW